MEKIDITNIFNDKLPWIVRYGLVISVICIIVVALFLLKLGKDNFISDIVNHFRMSIE